MLGCMSPQSPEPYRRETAWLYSQGAPGVFSGDTYYYGRDHNLTGLASEIDTSKVAVHLLTGEYDRLADDDGTPELAREIPGATYTMIPGLGHFGPSEHPELLKRYLLPVLEEIRSAE
jgi:pimeloyl-ACP methyl ester carboxylesterase